MKRHLLQLCFIFTIIFATNTAKAQLTFNSGLTATQLAQTLAGNGISITNATLSCPTGASGSFTGTSSIGIGQGIILTSGDISLASPNTNSGSAGSGNGAPGDPDLAGLAGATTYDACGLEFDVVPLCDTIKFKYVFGSEEYPEFVNSSFNDAFAFFISGPGFGTPTNIAKLPGTNTVVSIDNVSPSTNSQYYVANSGSTIEYDGYTVELVAFAVVQPCQTYHMKIVIADAGDGIFDSGVFLEAGSLQCAATVSADATVQNAVEGCQDGSFEFCRIAPATSAVTINYTIAGSAVSGTDYTPVATSITIPAGQLCASIPVAPINDGITEGTDSILIIYQPGPCPIMDTVVIYITDNILNAGPNKTICNNDTATIGTAISITGATYSWSPPTGLSNVAISNPVITGFNSGTTPVTTNYILTRTLNGCPLSDTVAVTVNPSATVNAGPDQTTCGGTIQLAGVVTGGTGATWVGGLGTYTPSDTVPTASYTPTTAEINAGSVSLILSANGQYGTCPGAIDTVDVTIIIGATVSAGPDQTVCFGNSATLIGSFGGTATSGEWSGGTGTFTPNNFSPTATYTPSTAEMTEGSVTLIYSAIDPTSICDPVTDQTVITIDQQPTANAGSAQSVCTGDSITLAGTIGGSATSATWSGGTGIFIPNSSTLNAVYVPSASEYAAGTVTLTLTTNDPTGPCTFSSSNVTFSFYELPVVSFSASPTSGCPVFCTSFTDASTIAGGATILGGQWNFGDGGLGSTEQNPTNCYVNSGYYDVTLTVVSSDGCVGSLTQTQLIEVFAVPTAEFSSSPNPASLIEPAVSFNNESSADATLWNWNFGDGSPINNTENPTHDFPDDTTHTYTVTLIAENTFGCVDTVEHEVVIGPAFTFYIPNAFTPNNDGKNDLFFGSGIGIQEYTLRIFDRWGNMVFKTQDLNQGWDGRAKNGSSTAQIDVFVWKVEIKDILLKKHSFTGTVTLTR